VIFTPTIGAGAQEHSANVERARAESNYRSIESWVPRRSRVLNIGARSGHLGELLRDGLECNVLGLEVIGARFDGLTLPVESHSVDVVLLLHVLDHAADQEDLLREARRVLRDGGCLLVAEDRVEGNWRRSLRLGLYAWLWLMAGKPWDETIRTVSEWHRRFRAEGLRPRKTIVPGRRLGGLRWANKVLFVLTPQPGGSLASDS
jgi:SAM-dependent methyltransferase